MRIFVVDNYDSFTYNLVHILECYADEVIVVRNDAVDIDEIEKFDGIVFSPGPGLPSDVPVMYEILKRYESSKSILGICLGHQAIAEFYGGSIYNMPNVDHGIGKNTKILETIELFCGVDSNFISGRYHSWAVNKNDFPEALAICAEDNSGVIMALKHTTYDVQGLQFHPESVLTSEGKRILKNWLV